MTWRPLIGGFRLSHRGDYDHHLLTTAWAGSPAMTAWACTTRGRAGTAPDKARQRAPDPNWRSKALAPSTPHRLRRWDLSLGYCRKAAPRGTASGKPGSCAEFRRQAEHTAGGRLGVQAAERAGCGQHYPAASSASPSAEHLNSPPAPGQWRWRRKSQHTYSGHRVGVPPDWRLGWTRRYSSEGEGGRS